MAQISLSQTRVSQQPDTLTTGFELRPVFQLQDYSFEQLILKTDKLPEQTALLGMAGHNIPFSFDLNNSASGALLIVSEYQEVIREQMLTIIRSLRIKNSAKDIQFVMISDNPDAWMEAICAGDPNYDYCGGVVGGKEMSAQDWILFLAEKTEQRLESKTKGASVLLFIDDCTILNSFDAPVRNNYEWLIKYGASVNIRVIGGLPLQQPRELEAILDLYKTQVFGQIGELYCQLLRKTIPERISASLQRERQFATKIAANWVWYWAPKLQG